MNEDQLINLQRAWLRVTLCRPSNGFLMKHSVQLWWELAERQVYPVHGPEVEIANFRRLNPQPSQRR